jgi:hypothetical protein
MLLVQNAVKIKLPHMYGTRNGEPTRIGSLCPIQSTSQMLATVAAPITAIVMYGGQRCECREGRSKKKAAMKPMLLIATKTLMALNRSVGSEKIRKAPSAAMRMSTAATCAAQ